MANIQISDELFWALCKYHLANNPKQEEYIKDQLSKKIDAMAKRQKYYNSHCLQKKTES